MCRLTMHSLHRQVQRKCAGPLAILLWSEQRMAEEGRCRGRRQRVRAGGRRSLAMHIGDESGPS